MIDHKIEADIELLFYGYRAFTAQADALLAERQWNRVHHRVLYFVARNPGIAVNQLLGKLGVSKQALHGPMKALQSAELIETRSEDSDKRVKNLYLTVAGCELENELTSPQRDLLKEIETELGSETIEAWRAMMLALSNKIITKA
ncbi:MarR family winged helix-turn-helix transcriptional regulator [Deefgea tanakiae]|jgi:DNA-binding MarR family transcriptional regulator|uniref:MarR family winged helix-turn-helix transcriptional regulator n=1 Tax=Deefgea tanakiae TaxID=2865840 RepID=UPI0021073326|nr:MarR family winged helix-turn-helix transcriptional regulator [Deefgea tanakiae]